MPVAPKVAHSDEAPPARPAPRRLLINAGTIPPGVLQWSSSRERSDVQRRWARAVCHALGSNAGRALRLAWLLERLAGGRGYAFASDTFLANETGIPRERVADGLLELERAGAIVRAHVPKGATTERRIWLGTAVIGAHGLPPSLGGRVPPDPAVKVPPGLGGQNIKERRTRLSELHNAERAARLRSNNSGPEQDDEEQARKFASSSPVAAPGQPGAPSGARRGTAEATS